MRLFLSNPSIVKITVVRETSDKTVAEERFYISSLDTNSLLVNISKPLETKILLFNYSHFNALTL
ncbi:hypothetical protein Barb7_02704 [Bacteroidales bacterium Barb7]|nr:hypothetical protein Barb7_02704 [Bacteroidales bacterium Barb7]